MITKTISNTASVLIVICAYDVSNLSIIYRSFVTQMYAPKNYEISNIIMNTKARFSILTQFVLSFRQLVLYPRPSDAWQRHVQCCLSMELKPLQNLDQIRPVMQSKP